jgi:uncharacterized protein
MGDMLISTLIVVMAILFLAGLAKSTLGFGESLLAMPLLTLAVGIQIATPLTALVMTTLTTTMLLRSWQRMDLRAAWRVMLAAVVGIPLGVWGLRNLPADVLTLAMGVSLAGYALFSLWKPVLRWQPGLRWGYVFGFTGGVMGGAVISGGPPILIYTTLRRLPPEEFRATLQGCFTPMNAFILLGHALGGFWTAPVLELYALSLPVIFIAYALGTLLSRRIPAATFTRLVYFVLLALGAIMIAQSLG